MKLKQKNFQIIILLIIFVLIFFIIGCPNYIIYLPSQVVSETSKNGENNKKSSIFDNLDSTSADLNNINVVIMSGPEAEAAKYLANDFEKEFKIKVTIYDASWDQIKKEIATPLSSISTEVFPIDVIVFPYYHIGEFYRYLQNLSAKIEEDNIDIDDYFPDIINSACYWKGNLYALPIQSSVNCVIYRKDLFLENNISYEEENWTYENYDEYLAELYNNDSFIILDPSILYIYWVNRYINMGGKLGTEDWEVNINNELGVKSLDMLRLMHDYTNSNTFNSTQDSIISDFISGEGALFEGFPDFMFTKYEEVNESEHYDDFGILPVPGGQFNKYTILDAKLIGLTRESEKVDKAWAWIKHFTGKETCSYLLDEYGILPSRISVYKNNELNEKFRLLKDIYNLLDTSDIREIWRIRGSYEIFELLLNESLNSYLIDRKSPEETLDPV